MPAPRNQVAIYSPFAHGFYEDPASSGARRARGGGGAELQTTLLARLLAREGMRVAHIVYPVGVLAQACAPAPEVVQRAPRAAGRGPLSRFREVLAIWRSLSAADARLYVFRTGLSGGTSAFTVGAAFCALHRRRLVLAASNDLDFIIEGRDDRSWPVVTLYRLALRRTRCVVVQSEQQLELARAALGSRGDVRLIPSFAEPAGGDPAPDPDAFLWAGRLVEYKLPLRFIELARAVPEVRFRMVAVATGETSAELRHRVESAAAQAPNLELLADQRRERLLELIARSVAVVSTSRHEGMPNVFLEAWARGVPVVSLHFDPDGRIAEQGIGVWAAGSWERFVAAIRELWSEPTLRGRIGMRGRDYVIRTHSPEAVGARWAQTVEGALER